MHQRMWIRGIFVAVFVLILASGCGGGGNEGGGGQQKDQTAAEGSAGAETSGGGAAEPVTPEVADAIEEVVSQPMYEHGRWGISVRDLSTGEVLIGRENDKMFIPASTFKTFVGATVLDSYGPDHRFKTPH